MNDLPSCATWIQEKRTGIEMTQAELAKIVGCSESLIERMELDEVIPSLPDWVNITKALGHGPEKIIWQKRRDEVSEKVKK